MYKFMLNKVPMPVTPEKITMKINGKNKTIDLINGGECNIIKTTGLTDIEFDLLLPNHRYPFAYYHDGYKRAWYYLQRFEMAKTRRTPFTFSVHRKLPDGRLLYDTVMKVTMEEYTVKEDAKEGFDVVVSIKLKQYREYGTKRIKLIGEGQCVKGRYREATFKPKTPCVYKVQKGDTLWSINKFFYGSSLSYKYHGIVKANKLSSCEDLPVGLMLKIP